MKTREDAIGYIVFANPRAGEEMNLTASAMGYGIEDDPYPELLLMNRCATIFDTDKQARDALKATLIKVDESGATWSERYVYHVIPVMRPDTWPTH